MSAKKKKNYKFNNERELNRYSSISFLLKFQKQYALEVHIATKMAKEPDELTKEIIKRGKALFDLKIEDYLL